MLDARRIQAEPRLVSLDAYRGLTMLFMASGGLALGETAKRLPDNRLLGLLAQQVEHVPWRGCTAWDLIQPSFMFIVGVAMPFSYAARRSRGDDPGRLFGHALWRALVLVMLGVFLSSAWSPGTNFTFVNVLSQIGLGYPFVYLLLDQSPRRQWLAAIVVLVAYWLFFALHAPTTVDPPAIDDPGVERFEGFLSRWNKHENAAAALDTWFLNLFPRPDGKPFRVNDGGYATLNFVPSAVTMLFGVIAGSWLRGSRTGREKIRGLVLAGIAGIAVGAALDPTLCPVVKRIWTPSWTLFSAGWTCLLLALFHGVVDVAGYRRWTFPLVVVGVNSIAFYVMAQLMKPFARQQLTIHLGDAAFQGPYGPLVQSSAVLLVFWLIALAMYRQRIFVRI